MHLPHSSTICGERVEAAPLGWILMFRCNDGPYEFHVLVGTDSLFAQETLTELQSLTEVFPIVCK